MDIAAFILSIISFVTSLIFAIYSIVNDNRINKKNLNAELYFKAYNKFLFIEIPEATAKVEFDEKGNLININLLQSKILQFLSSSVYYKFVDPVYYNDLKEAVVKLEDFLLDSGNKTNCSKELQSAILRKEEKLLKDIYILTEKKFLN